MGKLRPASPSFSNEFKGRPYDTGSPASSPILQPPAKFAEGCKSWGDLKTPKSILLLSPMKIDNLGVDSRHHILQNTLGDSKFENQFLTENIQCRLSKLYLRTYYMKQNQILCNIIGRTQLMFQISKISRTQSFLIYTRQVQELMLILYHFSFNSQCFSVTSGITGNSMDSLKHFPVENLVALRTNY